MASNTKKTGTNRTTTAKKSTTAPKPAPEKVVQAPAVEPQSHVVVKPRVELSDVVYVQSCFHGNLIYISKRTGLRIEWQRFGEEQPLDVDELMYMRNTYPKFFREQWVRLVGDNADDVFAFLHLERYCKNNLKIDNFDDVFEMEPEVLVSVVKEFAPSLRQSLARRAMELIDSGELVNLNTVKAVEKATGVNLLK